MAWWRPLHRKHKLKSPDSILSRILKKHRRGPGGPGGGGGGGAGGSPGGGPSENVNYLLLVEADQSYLLMVDGDGRIILADQTA